MPPHLTPEAIRKARNREHDARRREAEPWRRLYGTGRWKRLREGQLRAEPFCVMCRPALTPATVCDHAEPHKGDVEKFWRGPFQSLCATHHNSTKQVEEKTGRTIGASPSGDPLDPGHHWNARG